MRFACYLEADHMNTHTFSHKHTHTHIRRTVSRGQSRYKRYYTCEWFLVARSLSRFEQINLVVLVLLLLLLGLVRMKRGIWMRLQQLCGKLRCLRRSRIEFRICVHHHLFKQPTAAGNERVWGRELTFSDQWICPWGAKFKLESVSKLSPSCGYPSYFMQRKLF